MPFELITRKQLLGVERAEEIELPVLIYFDAARNYQRCPPAGYNHIAFHLVLAYYLAKRIGSPSFLIICEFAGEAWRKAGLRPGNDLGLTTREYKAVRACLGVYFRHLPWVEQGIYLEGIAVADKVTMAAQN